MVEFGVVPAPHGYAAVGLRGTLGKRESILIRSPVPLPQDVVLRILGALSREISAYLWEVSLWERIGLAVLVWAALGLAALATASIWSYGARFWVLYGWVRVWFLFDGVWLFCQYLAKTAHRRRAGAMRRTWKPWEVKEQVCPDWPRFEPMDEDEATYLRRMAAEHPDLALYYEQMLTIEPPTVHDRVPVTVIKFFGNAVLGPPVRLPRMVYRVGELR